MVVRDVEFQKMLERARARGAPDPDDASADGDPAAETDASPSAECRDRSEDGAVVIRLRPLRSGDRIWAEQNLGCEYPVCVANRRNVNDKSIRFENDKGVQYILSRDVEGQLPGPEAYKFWLWFLTSCCHHASTYRNVKDLEAPTIPVDSHELAAVFDVPKAKRGGYASSWYNAIDSAFASFAGLRVKSIEALWDAVEKKRITSTECLSLLSYKSVKKEDRYGGVTVRGWARPSPELWASIRANYTLSLPALGETAKLTFVAQRLMAWLIKHARTAKQGYTVYAKTLLPKIPLKVASDQVKRRLAEPHRELLDFGFLTRPPDFSGRAVQLRITYYLAGQDARRALEDKAP